MGKQLSADPFSAPRGPHVGVPDERHILHILDAHHAKQRSFVLISPEGHPGVQLMPEIFP